MLALAGVLAAGACGGDKTTEGSGGLSSEDASVTFFPSPPGTPVGDSGIVNIQEQGTPPPIPFTIPPDCINPGFPGGDQHFDFNQLRSTLVAAKPAVEARQASLLQLRYDLTDRPSPTVRMSRGKPVQTGVRTKLPEGITWDALAALTPAQIQQGQLFPAGFYPLPHPNHQLGGQLFTHSVIEEMRRQTDGFRDLARFDLDFDLPDPFLPEFPPAIFLTNHKELGDVSQGQVVTIQNFWELFKTILNPKELDGLRVLLTPFPQQEFNLTDDRRSERPSMGVACFDCHINGHTSGSIEILPDDRPQPFRRRGDTVSLRGLANNQLFGSKRAIETVEDFTEFEEKTAYFDGDITQSRKKGQMFLDRQVQLVGAAEFQRLLDFPPAPKLMPDNSLNPALASKAELRGEALFNGKARCASCHIPVAQFLDNQMHDLQLERFYTPQLINCRYANPDGPIKSFTLRGIKESPPYMHDGRLLTLDDAIEFFNLVLGTQLSSAEKADLLAYLYAL